MSHICKTDYNNTSMYVNCEIIALKNDRNNENVAYVGCAHRCGIFRFLEVVSSMVQKQTSKLATPLLREGIFVPTWMCVYVCMYVYYIYIHIHACMKRWRVCLCVCVYVFCGYVCIYIYTYIIHAYYVSICIYIYIYIYIHTYIHTYIYIHIYGVLVRTQTCVEYLHF